MKDKKSNKGCGGKIIIFILLLIGGGLCWMVFGPTVRVPSEKYLYIKTGATYSQVMDSLEKNNILSGTFIFDRLAQYTKYDKGVKPGRYKITQGMSVFNLLRMLKNGNQSQVNFIINKLRTREDMARKLGDSFEFDSLSAISFLNNQDSLSKYQLDSNTVLTAIIPNTYTFTWNNTPSKIFAKLYREHNKFWNTERKQKANDLHLTEKEVYILASIVEEETIREDDKGKIASVYLNRLRAGMKLAADPTVKFAMHQFGIRRILYGNLLYPSPYNTYLNKGLPPGPICTPSVKTLDAVLNEPATDYMFFVAKADLSGYSHFSSNYQEHAKYAKDYQHALDSLKIQN